MPRKVDAKPLGQAIHPQEKLTITHVAVSDLVPAAYNPRRMPDPAMRKLMDGIKTWGVVDPIIVNKTSGNIVGGHQRLEACKRLGLTTVPVVHVTIDGTNERALNLALNKISGEWDDDKLRDILQGLMDVDFDMALTGFDGDELADLLGDDAAGQGGEGDPDDTPEADETQPAVTQPGDIIILGEHRLLCGDSTDLRSLEAVMGGGRPTSSGPTRPMGWP